MLYVSEWTDELFTFGMFSFGGFIVYCPVFMSSSVWLRDVLMFAVSVNQKWVRKSEGDVFGNGFQCSCFAERTATIWLLPLAWPLTLHKNPQYNASLHIAYKFIAI